MFQYYRRKIQSKRGILCISVFFNSYSNSACTRRYGVSRRSSQSVFFTIEMLFSAGNLLWTNSKNWPQIGQTPLIRNQSSSFCFTLFNNSRLNSTKGEFLTSYSDTALCYFRPDLETFGALSPIVTANTENTDHLERTLQFESNAIRKREPSKSNPLVAGNESEVLNLYIAFSVVRTVCMSL